MATTDLELLFGFNGFRIDGAASRDNAGVSVSDAGDVNGDGIDDLIIGAFLADGAGGADAGAAYVVFGGSGGFPDALDLSTLNGVNGFRIDGTSDGDNLGISVSGAGDLNADGYDDVVVGASGADVGGQFAAGSAYVIFGSGAPFASALSVSELDGDNGFRILNSNFGFGINERLGRKVSEAGDFNGDGVDDVIVSSSQSAYVLFGSSAGFSSEIDVFELSLSDNPRAVKISGSDFALETPVGGGGDFNNDGIDDIIVSTPFFEPAKAYVVFGSEDGFDGTIDVDALDGSNGFTIALNRPGSAGTTVDFVGDANGDGIDDVILSVSARGVADAYVFFGTPSPSDPLIQLPTALDAETGFSIQIAKGGGGLGGAVVGSAGDVNNDGLDDIVLGRAFAGQFEQNYVVFGPREPRSVDYSSGIDPTAGFRTDSAYANELDGFDVAGGDFNGDGFSDVAIGAPNSDVGGENSGAVYVVFGGPSNATPIAVPDAVNIASGQTLSLSADDLLGNDINADNDLLAIVEVGDAVGGTVERLGNGGVAFTPDAGFTGPASFTYRVSDGRGGTSTASVSVNVLGEGESSGAADDVLRGTSASDAFFGGAGSDEIFGLEAADSLIGEAGNDSLFGAAGGDFLDGGADDDELFGGDGDAGADTLSGGSGDDLAIGGPGADLLDGGAGDDKISGDAGDDTLTGGAGFDTVIGGDGADLMLGGEGNDLLLGRLGGDTLDGGDGNDILAGANGSDLLLGGNDNDLVYAGIGDNAADTLEGGLGQDELFGFGGDDEADGGAGDDRVVGDGLDGFGDDTLRGGDGDDRLFGGRGEDFLDGGAGNDELSGNQDADTLVGGAGNDQIFAQFGDDLAFGGAGDDVIFGGAGHDRIFAGAGADTVSGGD
ncbi:MAG: cadherin-like domain-containing protein, partial [Pseudomonadota bacterium]